MIVVRVFHMVAADAAVRVLPIHSTCLFFALFPCHADIKEWKWIFCKRSRAKGQLYDSLFVVRKNSNPKPHLPFSLAGHIRSVQVDPPRDVAVCCTLRPCSFALYIMHGCSQIGKLSSIFVSVRVKIESILAPTLLDTHTRRIWCQCSWTITREADSWQSVR